MIIGIDFDGTCVTHEFPKIGQDIGAVPVLKWIVDHGHRLILFTMRSDVENPTSDDYDIEKQGGKYLSEAVQWFKDRGIPLYGINQNPSQHTWTHSPKPYCHIYIDDAALGVPLVYGKHKRPYVDWEKVAELLESRGVIYL
jgi:hypothetical protein